MAIKPQPQPPAPPSGSPSPKKSPQPLSFPALTFAKLAPSSYLTAHLSSPQTPLRASGRSSSQWRTPTIHTGSLTHAHGSAVVRCGETAAVCGVRAEILRVEDVPDWSAERGRGVAAVTTGEGMGKMGDEGREERERRKMSSQEISKLGLLVPNLELATGCSPAHLPGGPPSVLAQTLTHRIHTLLHTSDLLSLDDLAIWSRPPPQAAATEDEGDEGQDGDEDISLKPEIKAFWCLYIDILFISLSGSAFDTAWMSVLAALGDTKLPQAWFDPEAEGVLCDPDLSTYKALKMHDICVSLTFGVFQTGGGEGGKGVKRAKRWILADPDGFEEGLCDEWVTIVVGGRRRIVRIEKEGGGAVGMGEMKGLVGMAVERRGEWCDLTGLNGRDG